MRLLLIFLAMLWVVPARAQAPDLFIGNGYLKACTETEPIHRAVCTQYTLGMTEMLLALEAAHFVKPLFCAPDQVTGNQKRDILVKFLKDNPAIRHAATPRLLIVALQQAYPCPPDRALPPANKRM